MRVSAEPAIVAAGPIAEPAQSMLARFGTLAIAERDDPAVIRSLVSHAIALIARGPTVIDESLLEAAPELRVIGRTGVGVDGIDLGATTARGIPVVVTPGCNEQAVAEGAIAMLLSLAKRLPQLDQAVKNGEWMLRDTLGPSDVCGSVLAIAGFGRIGQRVAAMARALGIQILVCDPYADRDAVSAAGGEHVSLPEAVSRADHLSLHVPLNAETDGLITTGLLTGAKPGLRLVNVSRGGLAPLDVLLSGLASGALGGVAVDVFEEEPPRLDHPIFERNDVLCSPHAMALTPRSVYATMEAMATGIVAVLEGRRPEHVANPDVYEQ